MIFKTIAHAWASSNLQKEVDKTRVLINQLEARKKLAEQNIQEKKKKYESKILSYKEEKDRKLNKHIDFMNNQLETTQDYMLYLNTFIEMMFKCIESWMQVDLCDQELKLINQKNDTIQATIDLIETYINELKNLSQYKERKSWKNSIKERKLTISHNFIVSTEDRIKRNFNANRDEFKNEIKRLNSYIATLKHEINNIKTERQTIKTQLDKLRYAHEQNQKTLRVEFEFCLNSWNQIAKRFESYYAFEKCDLDYVNEWLSGLEGGGTLTEITYILKKIVPEVIRSNKQHHNDLNRDHRDLRDQQLHYKNLVKMAHNNQDYTNLSEIKEKRNNFRQKADDVWEDICNIKKELERIYEARDFLKSRQSELYTYINSIKPLHPKQVINEFYEMLNDEQVNPYRVFGIGNGKRKPN